MRRIPFVGHMTIVSAGLALAACGGGGSGGQPSTSLDQPRTGTLTVGLIDAPRWDVEEIWLDITAVNVKPAGDGPAHEFPFDPPLEVELLGLTPDNEELLLDNVVLPAGEYNWIELEVDADFDSSVDDSRVVLKSGGEAELRVPSGSVRLVSGFTITADRETRFTIDWDTRQGLVRPAGQPAFLGETGFMLRPALRIIDSTEYGTLSGTVAMELITPATDDNMCNADTMDENPDVGNVVYVFAGFGATADDLDGTDDAVATVEVAQNMAGDYVYQTILSPGEYTVAFTCQGGLDDPESDDELLFSDPADVEVLLDDTVVVDF